MKIKIGGIVETSLTDVLFNPSFVVWFSFCNFRCPWCSNFSLVKGEGEWIEINELVRKIHENKSFVEYVQATGGEPTLQPDGLVELFSNVKTLGLKTSLDTNGSNPSVVRALVKKKLIDHLAIDVKTELIDEKYWRVIGRKYPHVVEKIKKTLYLANKVEFVEVRTTFVPSLLNVSDVISALKEVKKICKEFNFVLQQFYPFDEILRRGFVDKLLPKRSLIEIGKKIKEEVGLDTLVIRTKGGMKII